MGVGKALFIALFARVVYLRSLLHNLQVIPAGVAMCASGYLVLQQFPTIGISIVRSSLG